MSPFYIGQRVIYVKGTWFPHGSEHIVKELIQLSCGCWAVSVGTIYEDFVPVMRCDKHPVNFNNTDNTVWFRPSSFAPIMETFTAITFEKIVETEVASTN